MPKTREFQALLYACTQEGCPLCRLVQEGTYRYLDTWKYETFTDVGVRQGLRQTQGFCHVHTWQLARMGATLQLAQAYRDVISDSIEQLQQGGETGSGRWRRFFEGRHGSSDKLCPACKQQKSTAKRHAHTFRQAILDEEEFYPQFASSDGLCLNHFRLICTNKGPEVSGLWLTRLRQAQLTCLQRLDQQLGELIRKHDYRFKDEPRGSEMHSWKRAAGLVAGEEEQR